MLPTTSIPGPTAGSVSLNNQPLTRRRRPSAEGDHMATRRPNHRLLKHRRTYTVQELAHRLSIHENTVRAWYTDGLESIDDGRPMLFRGDAVSAFLQKRRAAKKQPCGVGRLYCLPCRTPREPAGGMLDYLPSTPTAGSLSGLCPACHRMMFAGSPARGSPRLLGLSRSSSR